MVLYDCPNDWVCRKCHESGHKMMDCSKDFNEEKNKNNIMQEQMMGKMMKQNQKNGFMRGVAFLDEVNLEVFYFLSPS